MRIPAIKVSLPKVKAKKLNPKAVVETVVSDLKKAETKSEITPMRKVLPKSMSKQDAVGVTSKEQRKVVACGSFADWCNGGMDICGAYA